MVKLFLGKTSTRKIYFWNKSTGNKFVWEKCTSILTTFRFAGDEFCSKLGVKLKVLLLIPKNSPRLENFHCM